MDARILFFGLCVIILANKADFLVRLIPKYFEMLKIIF